MGLREKAVRGVAWSAARNWGSRLITLVVWMVFADLLSEEEVGLIAGAIAYVVFINIFVEQGFVSAIIQRDEVEEGHLDTAFWVNLGTGMVLAVASIVAAPQIAGFFETPDLAPILQWMALALVLAALAGMPQALFERALDYRLLAVRELVAAIVGGVVGVGMAVSDFGVWSLVGWQLGERVASVGVLWAATTWRPGLKATWRHFHDLFSFGINVVGTNLLDFANNRSDDFIILKVLGKGPLGFYALGYQLFTNGTQIVTQSVASVAFSTFSRLQNEPARMRQGFYTVTRVVSVIAFPIFMGGAALAPEIVEVVFDAKWLPQSAQVFQVLAFIGVLHALFYFNSTIMLAAGKPEWRLAVNAINAVANVTAFLLVVQWGIVAVAAAYVVRGYLLAPLPLILVRRLIGIEWGVYLRTLVAPALSTAIMVAGVLSLRAALVGVSPLLVLLAGVPLGAVLYTGTLWLFAPARLQQIYGLVVTALPKT